MSFDWKSLPVVQKIRERETTFYCSAKTGVIIPLKHPTGGKIHNHLLLHTLPRSVETL